MNEIDLVEAIRKRISEATKGLQLQTESDGIEKAPDVINGFLPPKRSKDSDDFPYVIVRPSKGKNESTEKATVEVKLLIGCFSEDYDGYEWCLLVLSEIRKSFFENPTLENRFEMEFPMDWDCFDDQPYPEWVIEVVTRWNIYVPQRIPDEGVL